MMMMMTTEDNNLIFLLPHFEPFQQFIVVHVLATQAASYDIYNRIKYFTSIPTNSYNCQICSPDDCDCFGRRRWPFRPCSLKLYRCLKSVPSLGGPRSEDDPIYAHMQLTCFKSQYSTLAHMKINCNPVEEEIQNSFSHKQAHHVGSRRRGRPLLKCGIETRQQHQIRYMRDHIRPLPW